MGSKFNSELDVIENTRSKEALPMLAIESVIKYYCSWQNFEVRTIKGALEASFLKLAGAGVSKKINGLILTFFIQLKILN